MQADAFQKQTQGLPASGDNLHREQTGWLARCGRSADLTASVAHRICAHRSQTDNLNLQAAFGALLGLR